MNDYKSYVKYNLEKYKTTHFTLNDIITIDNMFPVMTGKKDQLLLQNNQTYLYRDRSCLYNICDEQKNYFPHIAIQKFDLPVLTWFMSQKYIYYPKNTDNNGFIELCINHLSPHNNISSKKKKIAYNMLELLVTTYDGQLALSLRKPIVEKLLILQIAHKTKYFNTLLPDYFFTQFLTQGPYKTEPLDLQTLYQQTKDPKTGNNYTHIVIEQADTDALYELIQKQYISNAENKIGETPLMIALRIYQIFMQDIENLYIIPRVFTQIRCCLFMFLNYIKKNQGVTTFEQCCDKHII